MAMFMNEEVVGETYTSYIPVASGNAIRDASAQVTQALSNALGGGNALGMSTYDIYHWGNTQIHVTIGIPHPYYDAGAPPNTYKLTITPTSAENRQTIKTILQGVLPAGATGEGPAGAARRRRKSRKSKKSKKTSRRRRRY